jgi:general secretion pathway protein A
LYEVPLTRAAPYVPAFLARWLPLQEADPIAVDTDTDATAETPADEEGKESRPSLALARVDKDAPVTDLALGDLTMDRESAMRALLRRWGVDLDDLGPGDPCGRVKDYGLRCELARGDWNSMRFFDRPALIELKGADLGDRYAAIGELDGENATLDLSKGSKRIPTASLDEYWDGEYLVLWQPPPVGGTMIGPRSSGEPVRWLRKLLSQVPDLGFEATDSGTFDRALGEAVQTFQEREGLKTDGVAGPKTLIRLHNVVGMPDIPRLEPTP